MERFSQGLFDPQEVVVVDHCEECGGEIYFGQIATTMDETLFCNDKCLFENLGVVTITAGEGDE
jgi:hypothetical protein